MNNDCKNSDAKCIPHVIVVGSGLVGMVLSLNLAKIGIQVTIYEKRSREEITCENNRPSINITLCKRGLYCLENINVKEFVLKHSKPIWGRVFHNRNGCKEYQPYGNNGEKIYSVKRNDLAQILHDRVSHNQNITRYFSKKCIDVNPRSKILSIQDVDTCKISKSHADVIVGADGAFSKVRSILKNKKYIRSKTKYINYGYIEFLVNDEIENLKWKKDSNYIHIWPRKNHCFIGFPNCNGSFSLSLHMSVNNSFSSKREYHGEQIHDLLSREFGNKSIAHFIKKDTKINDLSLMPTVHASSWLAENSVCLIGDAAHAVVPYLGQGTNAGFEDCKLLTNLFAENKDDLSHALLLYDRKRRPELEFLADASIEHFNFLRKKLEYSNSTYNYEAYNCDSTNRLYYLLSFTNRGYDEIFRKST